MTQYILTNMKPSFRARLDYITIDWRGIFDNLINESQDWSCPMFSKTQNTHMLVEAFNMFKDGELEKQQLKDWDCELAEPMITRRLNSGDIAYDSEEQMLHVFLENMHWTWLDCKTGLYRDGHGEIYTFSEEEMSQISLSISTALHNKIHPKSIAAKSIKEAIEKGNFTQGEHLPDQIPDCFIEPEF